MISPRVYHACFSRFNSIRSSGETSKRKRERERERGDWDLSSGGESRVCLMHGKRVFAIRPGSTFPRLSRKLPPTILPSSFLFTSLESNRGIKAESIPLIFHPLLSFDYIYIYIYCVCSSSFSNRSIDIVCFCITNQDG